MNLSTVKLAQWDETQSRELLGLFICVCIALCTIVAHNTAQKRPDNFPPYPPITRKSVRCVQPNYEGLPGVRVQRQIKVSGVRPLPVYHMRSRTWQTRQHSCSSEQKTAAPSAAGAPWDRQQETLQSPDSRQWPSPPQAPTCRHRRFWNTSVRQKQQTPVITITLLFITAISRQSAPTTAPVIYTYIYAYAQV